jgi:hypothetical protein
MRGGDVWLRRKNVVIPVGVLAVLMIAGTLGGRNNKEAAKTSAALPTAPASASPPAASRRKSLASTAAETTTARPAKASTHRASVAHPANLAGFMSLAAEGDAKAIHSFSSETLGTPDCRIPNVYATARPGLSTGQLEADMAAYFIQRGFESQCRAALFLFRTPGDKRGEGFNAGRIFLDRNSDGSHNLTLDVGSVQETYGLKDTFTFDF